MEILLVPRPDVVEFYQGLNRLSTGAKYVVAKLQRLRLLA